MDHQRESDDERRRREEAKGADDEEQSRPSASRPDPEPKPRRYPDDEEATHGLDSTQGLLRRMRRHGSRDSAWQRLFERYAGRILVFTTRQIRPDLRRFVDPEDIVNEAWMRIVGRIDEFQHRGKRSLYVWLCEQVRRVILDRVRKVDRRGGDAVPLTDIGSESRTCEHVDDTIGPDQRSANAELLDRIVAALEQLPKTYRGPLEAVVLERRSREQVAADYGISRNTLNQRVSRGLARWREELGGIDPLLT